MFPFARSQSQKDIIDRLYEDPKLKDFLFTLAFIQFSSNEMRLIGNYWEYQRVYWETTSRWSSTNTEVEMLRNILIDLGGRLHEIDDETIDSSQLAYKLLVTSITPIFSGSSLSFLDTENNFRITAEQASNLSEQYEFDYEKGTGPYVALKEEFFNKAKLHKLFNYSTKHTMLFGKRGVRHEKSKKGRKVKTLGPLYGVELELSTNKDINELIDAQNKPFFYCKADSSPFGSCRSAFECVTRPMDYRAQRIAWGQWFANMWDSKTKSYKDFDTSKATGNGMHIHIDRASFRSKSHLQNFVWFIIDPLNTAFIEFISEREYGLNSFCPMPVSYSKSRRNDYKNALSLYNDDFRGAVYIKGNSGKTVEVRIFKGIVSYATVMKNLDIVDALYYFTMNRSYSQLTLSNFLTWLEKVEKNKYKALKAFLSDMPKAVVDISKYILPLYGLTEPGECLNKLKELNIPPCHSVVDYLNAKFPKLDDENSIVIIDGQYSLNPKMYGALNKYDECMNPFESTVLPKPDNPASERPAENISLDRHYNAILRPQPHISEWSI